MEKRREEFNFSDLLFSEIAYESEKNRVKEKIMSNFGARKEPSTIIVGDATFNCQLGAVLINLFLIGPFVGSDIDFTINDLFKESNLSQRDLEKYFNRILEKYRDAEGTDFFLVRERVADAINEMTQFSAEMNYLAGDTISFHDFLKLSEDKELHSIIFPKIEYGLQFDEIESKFKDTGKKIENFYKSHPESELYPFIVSKTGLNIKQLTQSIGFVGLKPDIEGKVIPVNIDKNYLTGLGSMQNYFINACGTRKALVTNKTMVRKSGYLTRKLSLLMMDRFHENEVEDCGTKHFVIYSIDNDKKLKMITGRHYYLIDQDSGQKIKDDLLTITGNESELIGKKIGLRSPVTCAGKHVCATCYGKYLSEINKNLSTGLAAVFRLTEPLTQKLLSAKHLLSTKTDKVPWGETFLEHFIVNMDSIYFSGVETTVSFMMPSLDDYDEDEDMYAIDTIFIGIPGSKKMVEYKSPVRLLVNPKFLVSEEDGNMIKIDSEEVSEDDFLFKFEAKNNELIKSLMQILDLIETREHLGKDNYHDFVNKFVDLLIENDMDNIPAVHIEMISSTLMIDPETKKRVDFSGDTVKPYDIYRVTKAVLAGPLSISLAFERINDQLIDLGSYEKSDESIMDYLFQ